ncbi:MAG: type II toxin-antitoxin system RelE/ParE family toxin [Bacteroidota bacterium]|nr:type II toxin-antitoxin system RelE/ParE family toxin [Bacteroidota bacterium]
MEIKILWSDSALADLEEIFDYHKAKSSPGIARNLVKSIIQKAQILESNPLLGVKEPLLSARAFEYRYLVEKNYKIIYRFNDNLIKVNTIFDCRQSPNKLESLKDK